MFILTVNKKKPITITIGVYENQHLKNKI